MWTLIFGSSTWTAVLIVHLADVEPPEKSQRPVLDWPGDLHWFGQTKGFDGESSESNSPWKRFAPNSICLPALHSTANLLMWDFVKTSPSFLAQQKNSRDSTQTVSKHCQASSRRCQGMLLNMACQVLSRRLFVQGRTHSAAGTAVLLSEGLYEFMSYGVMRLKSPTFQHDSFRFWVKRGDFMVNFCCPTIREVFWGTRRGQSGFTNRSYEISNARCFFLCTGCVCPSKTNVAIWWRI